MLPQPARILGLTLNHQLFIVIWIFTLRCSTIVHYKAYLIIKFRVEGKPVKTRRFLFDVNFELVYLLVL